jgi:GNAT superfamily N-acetyltransferase
VVGEATRVEAISRLDTYYATELDCDEDLLYVSGLHLVPTRKRTRPGWAGYTKPIQALVRGDCTVVSMNPDLESSVRAELGRGGEWPLTSWASFDRLRRASQRSYPYAFILSGHSMFCDDRSFCPLGEHAELLPRSDPRGRDLRARFDGEIFVVFGPRGEIASWAAIKLKSDSVWEIAVVTEPAHRGRGLARKVVAAATQHILEQGRAALYIYDKSNLASGKVCRSLGYQEYGQEFFCEY